MYNILEDLSETNISVIVDGDWDLYKPGVCPFQSGMSASRP